MKEQLRFCECECLDELCFHDLVDEVSQVLDWCGLVSVGGQRDEGWRESGFNVVVLVSQGKI